MATWWNTAGESNRPKCDLQAGGRLKTVDGYPKHFGIFFETRQSMQDQLRFTDPSDASYADPSLGRERDEKRRDLHIPSRKDRAKGRARCAVQARIEMGF